MSDTLNTEETQTVDVEALRSQLTLLTRENDAVVKEMAKYGLGPNPADIVNIRLNCLLAVILPEENRIQVEIMTQTMLSTTLKASLESIQKAATREQLLEGVAGVDVSSLLK